MMRQDRFTEGAQEVLAASQELVRKERHSQWDVEHVLMALLTHEGGVAPGIFEQLKVDGAKLREAVGQALAKAPKLAYDVVQIYTTPRIVRMLEAANAEAERLKDEYVGVEHLLIAIADEREGEAARILGQSGIDKEKIYRALQEVRGGARVDSPTAESKYRALERYSIDLTEAARQGKLDPVIGRGDEIKRVMQVLNRRTKNNPVIIGEAGVGRRRRMDQALRRRRARSGGTSPPVPSLAEEKPPSVSVICSSVGRGPGLVVSSASRMALRCSGVVPQQPPMILAPQSRASTAYFAISSGVPS